MSSLAGAVLVQSQSRRFISVLNPNPLMGSSGKILSQGKISSSILCPNDNILAAGIFKGCPEFLVSLGCWFSCDTCPWLPLYTQYWVRMEEFTPPEQQICKGNSFSSLPTPSGFRVMPAWAIQHRAVCQYSCPSPWELEHHSCSKLSLLYTRDGAVRAGSSTIRSALPEHAVKIQEIRPWQERSFPNGAARC